MEKAFVWEHQHGRRETSRETRKTARHLHQRVVEHKSSEIGTEASGIPTWFKEKNPLTTSLKY